MSISARARGIFAGEIKIPVWGDDSMEVTGFITQFTEKRYSRDYDPFWGEGHRATAEIDDKQYVFDILEALLQGIHYNALVNQVAKEASAAIAIFSINRTGSLDRAKELVEMLKRARLETGLDPLPIALVANRTLFEEDRVVTAEAVEALRQTGDYDIVIECFARRDDPSVITKLFLDLSNLALAKESEILSKQEEEKAKRPKRSDFGLEEEWTVVGRRKKLVNKFKGIFGF